MKIYFFPGLGADSSLAPYHILPGFDVQWIEWPKKFGATWDEFIQEIMNENEFEPDSIYAGISFGGIPADVPIQIIHGTKDRIIPWKSRENAVGIPDGGHLISMTHHRQINEAILSLVNE